MFYFDNINGKKILKSDFIDNAFFTTREICICDKSNQKSSVIETNIKSIEKKLQKKLIYPEQTHSSNIEIALETKLEYPDTDALILTNKLQAIFLNFADCTPIILYDTRQNIGAIAHAGWRGTAAKIAQKTVQQLEQSNPKDLIAIIGPTICGKCYEVGEEVYSVFYNNPHWHKGSRIDIKEINRQQLAEVGVEKIDICPYCTCCDNQYFYSYRKENATTLRHSAILWLK